MTKKRKKLRKRPRMKGFKRRRPRLNREPWLKKLREKKMRPKKKIFKIRFSNRKLMKPTRREP